MRTIGQFLLVGILISSVIATPVGAQYTVEEKVFINIDKFGDATIIETSVYNLEDETESETFERFQSDESYRQQKLSEFVSKFPPIASEIADRTGREVAVSESSITTGTRGNSGIVYYKVTLDNLMSRESTAMVIDYPLGKIYPTHTKTIFTFSSGWYFEEVTPAADKRQGAGTIQPLLVWQEGLPTAENFYIELYAKNTLTVTLEGTEQSATEDKATSIRQPQTEQWRWEWTDEQILFTGAFGFSVVTAGLWLLIRE